MNESVEYHLDISTDRQYEFIYIPDLNQIVSAIFV